MKVNEIVESEARKEQGSRTELIQLEPHPAETRNALTQISEKNSKSSNAKNSSPNATPNQVDYQFFSTKRQDQLMSMKESMTREVLSSQRSDKSFLKQLDSRETHGSKQSVFSFNGSRADQVFSNLTFGQNRKAQEAPVESEEFSLQPSL